MENLNIVLLGKTGHGKSATGNTILLENRFYVSSDLTSYTKMVERGKRIIGEHNVQVFDTPGPFDTEYLIDKTSIADIAKTCPLMDSMIAAGEKDGGVHAFFLVLTIGTRLTEEEMSTIKILEDIFGSRVFREFGVLVFTRGDNLEEEFSMWCARQDGTLKELMTKFNNRAVMTINIGDFSGKRSQFSKNMIEAAADLKALNKVYTLENYKLSEKSRTYLLVKSKKDELTAEFLKQINTLDRDINKCTSLSTAEASVFFSKINELRGEIKNANQGTDVLDGLYVHVDKLKALVQSKISTCLVM